MQGKTKGVERRRTRAGEGWEAARGCGIAPSLQVALLISCPNGVDGEGVPTWVSQSHRMV